MQEIEFSKRSISRGKLDVPMERKQSPGDRNSCQGYIQIKEHKSRVHLLQNCPLHRRHQATLSSQQNSKLKSVKGC